VLNEILPIGLLKTAEMQGGTPEAE